MRKQQNFVLVTVFVFGVIALASASGLVTEQSKWTLVPAIVFSSTHDYDSTHDCTVVRCDLPLFTAEIYMTGSDGTDPRRLTSNTAADLFPALSPDGKQIAFESNRNHLDTGEPRNTGDLFLMDTDGEAQTLLTRGSSPTWSPDGKYIAFHASATYYASGGLETGLPIRSDPGAPTSDSDIFVANVDDLMSGAVSPVNLTNSPETIDEDADWSPVAAQIAFSSHLSGADLSHTEIYVTNVNGTGQQRLTSNDYEERAPAWSPDGRRIAFMCSLGPINPRTGQRFFEICLMNADGSGQVQLTYNSTLNASPSWSPDGRKIVLHRNPQPLELWVIDLADLTCSADGSCTCNNSALDNPTNSCATPLTPLFQDGGVLGQNVFPKWGVLRVKVSVKK
jgi:Tol biopolymer transport system component